MKVFVLIFATLTSFSALAKQVEVQCATKAYVCSGPSCGWVLTRQPVPSVVPMYRDPNYPKEGAPYEVFRATYQYNYDRHLLTLNMEVKTLPGEPVEVYGTIDGGNVFAEATGVNSLDIGLRNHNYGRGFNCTSLKALN
jgi:hypothetical protein